MLQSHYRSTPDLTDDACALPKKGFRRPDGSQQNTTRHYHTGKGRQEVLGEEIKPIYQVHDEMNDDSITPKALAVLFDRSPRSTA